MLRMNRLYVVLALCVVAGTAMAADKADKAGKAKLRGEWAIMASELKLGDEQKAKLTEAVTAVETARSDWNKANGAKLEELNKAQKAARDANDKTKAKEISDQITALKVEQTKAIAAAEAKIQDVLTPEQKAQWQGFVVYRNLLSRFRKAELTDEQKTKVKAVAAEGAKQMATAGDAKAKSALSKSLEKQVTELLTPEQVAKMKAPAPKKEPKAEPKADAKAPAKPADGK